MKKKFIISFLIVSLLVCFVQYIPNVPKNYLTDETPPIVFVINKG